MINFIQNNYGKTPYNVLKFKKPAFGKITPEDTKDRPILIISDSWWPHRCGVTTATSNIAESLVKKNFRVNVLAPQGLITDDFTENAEKCRSPHHPDGFRGETSKVLYGGNLKVSIAPYNRKRMKKMLAESNPAAIYCTVEFPLGTSLKNLLKDKDVPYMTSYLTKWPEYFEKRTGSKTIKEAVKGYLKNFHNLASKVMVTTKTMKQELTEMGVKKEKLVVIPRGVDLKRFNPDKRDKNFEFIDFNNPDKKISGQNGDIIIGYVGRISAEKNIEELLELSRNKDNRINGGNYKVVIIGQGDPAGYVEKLEEKYPDAIFTGYKKGDELAKHYANMDVFAFPSKWDTFGIVQLESLACGTPVAAHDEPGPRDVVGGKDVGYLEDDLSDAIVKTLRENQSSLRARCRSFIENNYSWEKTAEQLAENLDKIDENKLKNALGIDKKPEQKTS